MNKYIEMNEDTRRSEWRSDRLDCYGTFVSKMKIYEHVFRKRLYEGEDPVGILSELLARMLHADEELAKKLSCIDAKYYDAMFGES